MGVVVESGSKNRREAVVFALVDVAARSEQQFEASGVAFLDRNINWRGAVVSTLVDVAVRSISFIGQTGCPE